MREIIASLASSTAELLSLDVAVTPDDIENSDAYVGPGYAVSTPESLAALRLMARTEGILLDPVYTAKALAGLIDHVQRGVIGREDTVIFVHTGGIPALFARAQEMASALAGPTPIGATTPS